MPLKPGTVWFTILLGLLLGLTPLGTDSFLPAMPAIARGFDATAAAVQLAVTTFFLGVAAGQLAWGPLSDRYGRRTALLAGLALFFAASLACAAAQSVAAVVAGRLAQGLGMSSGPVVARSVVRDLYEREHAAGLLARMMVVFGVVPIAAPLVGAGMLALRGWPGIFWLMAAIALALATWVALGLEETAPLPRAPAHPRRLAANLARLLADRRFVGPLVTLLCTQVGIYAFVSNSAFVLVHGLGLSPIEYSLCFSAVMLGQIAGAQLSSRLVLKHGIAAMVRTGTRLASVSGLVLAALAWAGAAHWSAVVLPMIVYMFASSYVLPHATAAALSPFPQFAGAASSLLGACQFSVGAAVSAGLGAAFDGTARPMASVAALAGLGALAGYSLLLRERAAPHGNR
ncbi:MAG TPA: multidrug effflux MFS transporter [Burkholderiales bacterium]|nr:multidrug effflux MFS transporter [Burkholderiales bacterium]